MDFEKKLNTPYCKVRPWMMNSDGLNLKGDQLIAFALLYEATAAPAEDSGRITWDYVAEALELSDASAVYLVLMKLVQAKLAAPCFGPSGEFRDQFKVDAGALEARLFG